MVSCSEFQVFIFISNNIDDICFNRARLHLHKKGYSKFSLNFVTLMKSMMMNRFGGMVDRQKASGIISSWDHCQRSSTARIFDTPRARFEPELRPWWMRLCSSDNHYTTAQLYVWNVKTALQWKSFKHCFVPFEYKFSLVIQIYAQFWFFRERLFSNMYLKQERYFSCYFLWTGQISLSIHLLYEILGNMRIAIICLPIRDVIKYETNFSFLIKPFSIWSKSHNKNINILRTKRAVRWNNSDFIGITVARNCLRPGSVALKQLSFFRYFTWDRITYKEKIKQPLAKYCLLMKHILWHQNPKEILGKKLLGQ